MPSTNTVRCPANALMGATLALTATLLWLVVPAGGRALAEGQIVAASHGLDLTFEKAAVADTVWVGRVDGDVSGVLTTVLISADTSAPVWRVEFFWIITADDPAQSFVARLEGTLDTGSGEVAMSGTVVDGYRRGSAVDERGQLFDEARSAFRGTIALLGS
jgi:hypothetical protein